jgi:hypothetical protein
MLYYSAAYNYPISIRQFQNKLYCIYTHFLTARFTSPVTNSVQGFMINYINNYGVNGVMCWDYSCGSGRNDLGNKVLFPAINIVIITWANVG